MARSRTPPAVPGAQAGSARRRAAELIVQARAAALHRRGGIESAPRDLQAPEQTVVEWCLKNPAGAARDASN